MPAPRPTSMGVLGVTLHAFTRVSVPLFVMLSGWLLLTAPVRSTGDFLHRRLPRILWPLLGASAFFIFWRAWLYGDSWTVASALKGFIAASIYYHLWYLYLILSLYLITPLLRTWYIHADTANRRLALGFWIGLLVVPPIIHRLTGPEWFLTGEMWLDYGGIYVLGAWLGAREPDASACAGPRCLWSAGSSSRSSAPGSSRFPGIRKARCSMTTCGPTSRS